MIGIGDRLGLYRASADRPHTSVALAEATGTHERYVREWCLQQTAAGILVHDRGTFTLPAGSGLPSYWPPPTRPRSRPATRR